MPKNDNFSPRQQEYFHSSHQGVYKEKKTKYYYQTGLEKFESKSIKNDPESGMNTQGVRSYDNMDITANDGSGVKHYGENGNLWLSCNCPDSDDRYVEVTL